MNARSQTPPPLFDRAVGRIHCVGIGGMGLGPLAIHFAGLGFVVSGGDDELSPVMRPWLERAGITLGPADTVPADAELLVFSSAIPASHPARLAAAARGVPEARRGLALAEVAKHRRLVAVCGSHGKTSTTALLIHALRAAGQNPGWVGGGLFADDITPPAAAGTDDLLVAEVDESDGTIGAFAPWMTVLVNLDWDHPDHYRTEADLENAFSALLDRTSGPILTHAGCVRSSRLTSNRTKSSTFGTAGDFTLVGRADLDANRQELTLGGRFPTPLARVTLSAFGPFNALNATAALAAACLLGAEPAASALADYPGVRRRQSVLTSGTGLVVIEDYAHHPAEIAALLSGLRPRLPAAGRLRVVYQPHRYTRARQFRAEFAAALSSADALYLLDVYGAGETPVVGGRTADLATECLAIRADLPVVHLPGPHGPTYERLSADLNPGDLVAIVGAGDLDQSARAWIATHPAAGWWDRLADHLRASVSTATRVAREEPLAAKTTIGVGGAARLYAEPANATDLGALLRTARALDLRVLPLGRGSNLLVPDEGVDALVVSLRQPAWETFTPLGDGRVRVGAGLRLKNLCGLAAKAGLAGFEFLEGIPGNVGGALRMNAGAMGGWMFDVVERVEFIGADGEPRSLAASDMHVGYRHCTELENGFATAAILRPASAVAPDAVAAKVKACADQRRKSQPREPSAGCIFKNPPGDSAGRLIDVSGLKGTREGGAEVSPVHANFIVNRDHASAADVVALVRRVRAEVERARGVRLQPEVILYGKDWNHVL